MTFPGERVGRSELFNSRGKDHFLLDPPLQPKREIGEYVAARGILVPRMYRNWGEDRAPGQPFMARSEYLQEYAGPSGLLESYTIIPGAIPNRSGTLEERVLAQFGRIPNEEFKKSLIRLSQENIERYVLLTGKNLSEEISKISYSFWERLGGVNSSIIADNAVPGKYHIFSRDPEGSNRNWYSLVQDGEVFYNQHDQIEGDIRKLIELYESVRQLDKFDPNHCPIIEAQSVGGEHYFLQYHRTRDFAETTHSLERVMEQDETRAVFVRGATPPEGIEVNLDIHFSSSGNFQHPLSPEEGAMGWSPDFVYTELMRRKRQLEIFDVHNPTLGISNEGYHVTESQLFKPAISIGVDSETYAELSQGVEPSGEHNLGQITVHCVSDGTNAFLKRVA